MNAAGLMTLAPRADFDLAALDRMHRTNIRGTFVVNQPSRPPRPAGRDEAALARFANAVHLERPGTPADIASAAGTTRRLSVPQQR